MSKPTIHRAMLLRDEPRLQAILPQGAILCGQEPVEVVLATDYATLEAENAKLRAELERRAVDAWIPVSLRLPSSGQLVIASGYRFGKLENGSWVEPAIYEDDDRNFHPPKPGEEGDLVADFDATMIHTNYWMPLPAAPEAAPSAPKDDDRPLYTCIGKGGEYRYLGTAIGAGDSRGELAEVYQDRTGQLFHRTPEDFMERMEPIAAARHEGGKI